MTNSSLPPTKHEPPTRRELLAVWALIASAIALALVPDAYGWSQSRPDHTYVGFSYNIDDAYVYMSWTKQAMDGHFFAKNLFTNAPQLGRQFNLYFLLVGNLCRAVHLPMVAALTVARVAFGVGLLWMIYRLILWALPGSSRARIMAQALSAVGTGLGWIYFARWISKNHDISISPVDSWQPEAFTFLSLLMSSLFVVSTLLIVASLFLLLRSEERGSTRDAAGAGLCALALGNIHSYDVLHIAAAWGLFLIVKGVVQRRFDAASWGRASIAGGISLPTVLYQFYLFKVDPVFHARAEVSTASFSFITYALGYGLTLLFAIAAAVLTARSKAFVSLWRNPQVPLMLICWVVAVFVLVYVPSSFQRKMIMGLHVPLCLLAGAAVAFTADWLSARAKVSAGFVPLLVMILSVPTSLIWIARDIGHINHGDSETLSPTFLTQDDFRVFDWIDANTRPSDTFAGYPTRMLFVPAYCDRRVWCGHWGETPDYNDKMRQTVRLTKGRMPNPQAFIEATQAQYLVWPNVSADVFGQAPVYLKAVYSNKTYTIYRIM